MLIYEKIFIFKEIFIKNMSKILNSFKTHSLFKMRRNQKNMSKIERRVNWQFFQINHHFAIHFRIHNEELILHLHL